MLTHGNYASVIEMVSSTADLDRGRGHLPLSAARPRVRAAHRAPLLPPRRGNRLFRRRHEADHSRADRGQADIPPVGAADLREDLHARARFDRRQTARGASPGGRRNRTWRESARHDGARRSGSARAAGALRKGRRGALRESARDLRGRVQARDERRSADRQGDPRILLRVWHLRARGIRDDGDRDGGDVLVTGGLPLRHRGPGAPGSRDPDRG